MNRNKRYIIKKAVIIGIAFLFPIGVLSPLLVNNTITANYASNSNNDNETSELNKRSFSWFDDTRNIQWDVKLNFTEPGGQNDWVVFGEAPDANDGPPPDSYDLPKSPPPPDEPYIRAWLDDGLTTSPYDKLAKDYREYPDENKVWNLTVQWKNDSSSPYIPEITISWITSDVNQSEYTDVELWNSTEKVADMLTENSYTYTQPYIEISGNYYWIDAFFEIICSVSVNQPPVAVNDTAETDEDNSVVIDVLDNDYDNDGDIDPTTVEIIDDVDHGETSVDPDTGEVTYTPDSNYYGSDSFTYTVDDDEGATSNEATVSITVNPVNDPPVAVDDIAETNEDTSVVIDVLANDYDIDDEIDPTTVTIVDDVNHGETSVNPSTGEVTYTPDSDYYGSDSFTYTVDDEEGDTSNEATVDITVKPVNDPPVAVDDTATCPENTPIVIDVLTNDYDIDSDIDEKTVEVITEPSHGNTSVNPNNGVVTYTPDPDFHGSDSFTYTVDDDEGATSNEAMVNITIVGNLPPNRPNRPSGQTRGKWGEEYTYKTSTIDPENDQVWYNFSWGDGTYSGWVGPFGSGDPASANHKWNKEDGQNFQIKVMAKDEHDLKSSWSDPLAVTMPVIKASAQGITKSSNTKPIVQNFHNEQFTDKSVYPVKAGNTYFSSNFQLGRNLRIFIDFLFKLLQSEFIDNGFFDILKMEGSIK